MQKKKYKSQTQKKKKIQLTALLRKRIMSLKKQLRRKLRSIKETHARKAALELKELTGAKAPKPKISDRHLQLKRHGF